MPAVGSGSPLGCHKARHWRKKRAAASHHLWPLHLAVPSEFFIGCCLPNGSRASPNKVRENRRRNREEKRDATKKSQALGKDDDDWNTDPLHDAVNDRSLVNDHCTYVYIIIFLSENMYNCITIIYEKKTIKRLFTATLKKRLCRWFMLIEHKLVISIYISLYWSLLRAKLINQNIYRINS